MSALAILWYFLIFVLIAGYFVLDGFDLGVGVLYPFVCKNEDDQRIVRRAIGPVWDGNEVWLLTAGGALFAAFPDAYATTFSGFYLAIMLVLFALIVRAVCFEFYEGDSKWRGVWNVCFFLGSLLPALLFGVAVGNVMQGIPMDAAGNYIGIPLLGLITPFTLLCGLLGLVMFIAAGACWLALKAPIGSDLQVRAAKLRVPMQWVAIILFALASIWMFAVFGGTLGQSESAFSIVGLLVACLFLSCIIASIALGRVGLRAQRQFENMEAARNEGDMSAMPNPDDLAAADKACLLTFVFQSLSSVSLVILVAATMFPNLVNASPDSIGGPVTLMTAGASELSLFCMTVILCIGLPLVLVYHILIYRTFRGRVALDA